ncbi:hypothetical protein FPV67DRAFT_1664040 [Lyophyllum atratum]|nr:hypothetical protein FPV67DRAFT_1680307 [Lyophyllum atratum]KAF8063147.1 hypothetical protein FPV67DRAFT_1672186 [Lyophyllum atratum]KAF8074881.1 hypothetical protein FPV67DRAFT_1665641 [Lyophyllum atratum]KAF8079409.1 hypothetical protein FPV67DRAFT_1664040 [Lyophyllum atratum]
MRLYIQHHLPHVTNRVEFQVAPPPALPSITTRTEFTTERLAYSDKEEPFLAPAGRDRASPTPPDADGSGSGPRGPRLRRGCNQIPKPAGEPGRPNSGGFCVEAALLAEGWSKQSAQELREAVRTAAQDQLDLKVSYKSQHKPTLRKICAEMMGEKRWPVLKNYAGCWPVHSMLKLALKYFSEAARRNDYKESSQRLRAALRGESPPAAST